MWAVLPGIDAVFSLTYVVLISCDLFCACTMRQGEIDPSFFIDPDTHEQYVLFKQDGNSCGHPTPIFLAKLSANGTNLAGPPVTLITNDPKSWEGPLTEAPWMVKVRRGLASC